MRQLIQQIFRTKSIDTLLREASAHSGLKRTLGLFDLVILGVGVILGTGIFVVTGRAAAQSAGPAVVLSFAIAGTAAGLAALCYAEMGSMLPISGSAYTYAYATMGEFVAFMIGWTLILEWVVSAGLVAAGWSGYFVALCRSLSGLVLDPRWCSAPLRVDTHSGQLLATGAYLNVPAILFTALISLIVLVGMEQSARFNAWVVGTKFCTILLFLICAVPYIQVAHWQPFIPANSGVFGKFGWSGVMQGATLVYLSFIGFDAVTTTAQEAKNPQRDIPLGTLSSVALCTFFYIVVAAVLTGVVPYTELAVADPLARGLRVTGIAWLESAVSIGAVIGLASCLLGALVAQPRIFLAMSRDGMLPSLLARVHARFGTPHWGTLLSGILCAVLAGLFPIEVLGELASVGTLIIFFLVSLCVIILRLKRPLQPRRFRVPGNAFGLPLLSATVSVLLIVTATPATLLRLTAWTLLGMLVYATYGYHRSTLRQTEFCSSEAMCAKIDSRKLLS